MAPNPPIDDGATALAKALAALQPMPRAFVLALLSDPSQTASAAYRAAGYKARGPAAETGASRLLRNAKVKAALEAAHRPVADKLLVTVERIEREYARIAFARIRDAVNWSADGGVKLLDADAIDEDTHAAIREVRSETTSVPGSDETLDVTKNRVSMHDKIGALRELGKRHGFYTKPQAKTAGGVSAKLVTEIRRRVLGIESDGEGDNA